MPVSTQFLRLFLAVICVFCAHFLGRAAARRIVLHSREPHLLRWSLRTLATAAGAMWHGPHDPLSLAMGGLAAVSAAAGFYVEQKPKKIEEDLTDVMFPKD